MNGDTGKTERQGTNPSVMDWTRKHTAFLNRELAAKNGGIGLCGRPVCCRKWLLKPNALKISIRMAKSQKIPLDPDNLHGYCQQIKCCVAFECDDCGQRMDHACQAGQRKQAGREPPR